MTKTTEKKARTLTCAKTGKTFEYIGVGRPPKYCPEAREGVRKGQRAAAQKAKREKTAKRRDTAKAGAEAHV